MIQNEKLKNMSLNLRFCNIHYSVSAKEEEKPILRNISGKVDSGEMMCILGPSGSGKTSLIQIIAGRIKSTNSLSHRVSGSIKVNDKELTTTEFRRVSGLVTQEDVFEGCLTVEETLYFKAALMLNLEKKERQSRIDDVIAALQLESCQSTFIGDDSNPYMKGISGGEKRRLVG